MLLHSYFKLTVDNVRISVSFASVTFSAELNMIIQKLNGLISI